VGQRVVVTGSRRGSKTAWLFLRLILSFYRVEPLFVHERSKLPKRFDALIVSGGIDICPKTYGSTTEFPCNEARDEMELLLLDRALKENRPILGICRGMQLINVYFGGSLHHDIHALDLDFPHPRSPFPAIDVTIHPFTKLRAIFQTSHAKVNALHHQAIASLGEGLRVSATDANGIVQAIEHQERFVIGVQWHPEYMPYSPLQRRLFKSFVNEIGL